MQLFPAIDIYEGKVVRLYKGDYNQMKIYGTNPVVTAKEFEEKGAQSIHIVDLQGAQTGKTPNLSIIKRIASETSLFTEVGGGIRSMYVVRSYLEAGVDRVIIGTAAVTNPKFLDEALSEYGKRIAVGVDILGGKVAIKGWTEASEYSAEEFCEQLQAKGVKTIICTDISKDGVLGGANLALYKELTKKYSMDIIASGGVSSIDDLVALDNAGVYGAIIGKAYYEGVLNLDDAIRAMKED